MNAYATLTYRQTVEAIRRLNGGTVGFDYGRFKLADLRAMLGAAIAEGTYDAEQCDAVAEAIIMEATAAPAPFAATALPKLGGARVAPPAVVLQPAAPAEVLPIAPDAPYTGATVTPEPQPVVLPPEPAPVVVAIEAPAPAVYTPATSDAPARMPLAMAFPKVKLPAMAFNDCAVYAHPDAPAVDPHYVFDADALAIALACAESPQPMNFYGYGAPGTGKTEFARQFAARTGRAFFRIVFDRNLERAEFIGSVSLENGSTRWQDGTLLQAYRTPGAVLLLDEPDMGQAGNLGALNGLLEEVRAYRVADTGEIVRGAPGLFIMGCGNSNLTGDATGLFVGVSPVNAALSNRFAAFVRFDYLGKVAEAKVLRDRTGLSKDAAEAIANLLHVCRQRADAGNLPQAPGLREAVAMSRLLRAGLPAPVAYETAVCSRAVSEAREELRNLFAAHWPQGLLPAFACCAS